MNNTTVIGATASNHRKQLTRGCRIRLWTGECGTLLCFMPSGDVAVRVDGQRGTWEMMREHVTAV